MNEVAIAEVARTVAEEFDIGRLILCEPIGAASRRVGSLTTSRGNYVLKPAKSPEAFQFYADVETLLNSKGVRQARVFSKPDGTLISRHGFALYEMMEGSNSISLNAAQIESTMAYMANYNAALAGIPVPSHLTSSDDPWNRAVSPIFLVEDLLGRIDTLGMSSSTRRTAERCVHFLSSEIQTFHDLSSQLVHSDIGPGNILYNGDDIVSVIDFSPHAAPELYSLCGFFYWQFLWFNEFDLDIDAVRFSLDLYAANRPAFSANAKALRFLMVMAAAFRLFGPIMAMAEGLSSYTQETIDVRAGLVDKVLDNESLSHALDS